MTNNRLPQGELLIRVMAMPAQTNGNGDIFGGWILSQMDLGGASMAIRYSQSKVVTVAVDRMSFLYPVRIGDVVSCYGTLRRIGRTSLTIYLETWVLRPHENDGHCVTEGLFTYVAIDEHGKPTPVGNQKP